MQTYEMVALADENGREYESLYGTYNKDDGFKFNESVEPIVEDKGYRELVNILFHENLWRLKKEPIKEMTLQELEKQLGYKVKIVDPEPKKEVSPERKKQVDDTIDFFRRYFGINGIDPEDYY